MTKGIDNIDKIKEFIKFEKGSYYKFSAIVRKKDELAKLGKNSLIRSWFIEDEKSLDSLYPEMKELCDLTGARLYMCLDRKNILRTLQDLVLRYTNILIDLVSFQQAKATRGVGVSIKTLAKQVNSSTSDIKSSDRDYRTYLYDIDTKEKSEVDRIVNDIIKYAPNTIVLETVNGYHAVVDRRNFIDGIPILEIEPMPNSLGLVYAPIDITV